MEAPAHVHVTYVTGCTLAQARKGGPPTTASCKVSPQQQRGPHLYAGALRLIGAATAGEQRLERGHVRGRQLRLPRFGLWGEE